MATVTEKSVVEADVRSAASEWLWESNLDSVGDDARGIQGESDPSGPRQTVCNLSMFLRARLTLARMSVALAVHMKGLGSLL